MNYNANQYLHSIKEYKWYRFDNIPGQIAHDVIRIIDENSNYKYELIWDETGEYFAKIHRNETNYVIKY